MSGFYNGYSPSERGAKYRVLLGKIKRGEHSEASGPCMLCGDPDSPVMYHDEDYSKPYLWEPPALLVLCRRCHSRLHRRFTAPARWQAFLAHVRRGGWARDLAEKPKYNRELNRYQRTVASGEPFELEKLRTYPQVAGTEWFEHLSTDPASRTSPSARPRP